MIVDNLITYLPLLFHIESFQSSKANDFGGKKPHSRQTSGQWGNVKK
jgi:hypothetical protein